MTVEMVGRNGEGKVRGESGQTSVLRILSQVHQLVARVPTHGAPESNMAAYKIVAVKVTPPNNFPLGLIRSHMVVIHLFLMLCDLQRVVRDLRTILYIYTTLVG
jgi:hypothetical protein